MSLCSSGRPNVYNVNALKTWLLVKDRVYDDAKQLFVGTGIQMTSAGRAYLGAPLGSDSFMAEYTDGQVAEWCDGLSRLAAIADTQPHAAYSAFLHGFLSKWNYFFALLPIFPPNFLHLRTSFAISF